MEEQPKYTTKYTTKYSFGQKAAAWAVHAFTASGIVAGFWGIVSAAEGNSMRMISLNFSVLTLLILTFVPVAWIDLKRPLS